MESCLQSAWDALQAENYIPYEDVISSKSRNPEMVAIEKDLFEKVLSTKAKFVVQIIFEEPEELCPPIRNCGISWSRVNAYMIRNHSMKRHEMDLIKKEIKRWLNLK